MGRSLSRISFGPLASVLCPDWSNQASLPLTVKAHLQFYHSIALLVRLKLTCPAHILFRNGFVFFRLSALSAATFILVFFFRWLPSLFRPKATQIKLTSCLSMANSKLIRASGQFGLRFSFAFPFRWPPFVLFYCWLSCGGGCDPDSKLRDSCGGKVSAALAFSPQVLVLLERFLGACPWHT